MKICRFYLDVHVLNSKYTNVAREVRRDMGTRNTKQTSRPVAKKASALLRDGRTSAKMKSIAASALAQAKPRKGK